MARRRSKEIELVIKVVAVSAGSSVVAVASSIGADVGSAINVKGWVSDESV
jgi:hypothetical protein